MKKLRVASRNLANTPSIRAGDNGVLQHTNVCVCVCGNVAYQCTHVLVQSCTHRPKLFCMDCSNCKYREKFHTCLGSESDLYVTYSRLLARDKLNSI